MKHLIGLGLLLFALWLLLSAHFEPLMISFGLISVLFTLYMTYRLDLTDSSSYSLHQLAKLGRYWLFLGHQIVLANLDVALRILGFRPIQPRLIKVNFPHEGDVNKVIFANSVTLTPGSASVDMQNGDLLVHTLGNESAQNLLSGEFGSALPKLDKATGEPEVKA